MRENDNKIRDLLANLLVFWLKPDEPDLSDVLTTLEYCNCDSVC